MIIITAIIAFYAGLMVVFFMVSLCATAKHADVAMGIEEEV